jgi:7-cyano-7-deazaguanine synthase
MSHTDYNGDRSQLNEWGYGKLDNPASKLRASGYREAKKNGWI